MAIHSYVKKNAQVKIGFLMSKNSSLYRQLKARWKRCEHNGCHHTCPVFLDNHLLTIHPLLEQTNCKYFRIKLPNTKPMGTISKLQNSA